MREYVLRVLDKQKEIFLGQCTRNSESSHVCFLSLFSVDIQFVFVDGLGQLFCHEREYRRRFPQTGHHRYQLVPVHHTKGLQIPQDVILSNNEDWASNQVYLMKRVNNIYLHY